VAAVLTSAGPDGARRRRAARGAALVGLVLLAGTLPGTARAADPDIVLRRVLQGYERPVLVTHDGRPGRAILVVEQTGRIHRATFRDGRWRRLGVFLDLRALVSDPRVSGGERGLLGLAFDPRPARKGHLYVNHTRRSDGATVVAEYRQATRARANPRSRRQLLVVRQPYANHNGGHLAFGPDRRLYIGLGDGGSAGDPHGHGQDRTTRLGSILRIDPRDPDGSGPKRYSVPRSNPFVGRRGHPEVWAYGLRNPWRFSFDRATGDLWIGDVGQARREEVNRAPADGSGRNAGRGLNFGWNACEGGLEFADDEGDADERCSRHTLPVHDYGHGAGRCAVTGGHVFRGPGAPAWRGLYVAGDYCGRLFVLDRQGRVVLSKVTSRRISSFGEDRAGRLFLVDHRGGIFLVRFRGVPPGG
jgi:glucose/arabinose dehydrogenase